MKLLYTDCARNENVSQFENSIDPGKLAHLDHSVALHSLNYQ